jgi:hypothetical protein
MKRLCFLSPDIDHAKAVVQDLRDDGIVERHIYAIAKSGISLGDLPDGGPEDDDFLPAFERGVALGGATGLFAGLLALAFPPAGLVIGGGAVLLVGMMGASLGGLLTGMAGAAFSNSRLKAFEQDIDAGKILIMVDVPQNRITHVNGLIRRLDPEVEIEGVEPPAPVIPG